MRAEPIVMISFGLQTRRNNGRAYTVILFGIVQITFHIFGIYIEWQNIYTAARQRGEIESRQKVVIKWAVPMNKHWQICSQMSVMNRAQL